LRLLLDTHIWVWSVQDPDRLSERVQAELADPENERWLSPISAWEVLTLEQKNRISLLPNFEDWMAGAIAPFRQAPITHDIALASRHLTLRHNDPADRLLVATAKVLGLTLVTADKLLLDLREISILSNR
jgi:PIN domain nuclease of toxin-antitoxin system